MPPQMPTLRAWSSLLYQMLVMVTNAGDTAPARVSTSLMERTWNAPSVTPRSTRMAANPAKFVGAARHMHTTPQRTLLPLVIGRQAIHRYPHSNRNKPRQWKSTHKIDKRAFRDQLPYSVRTEPLIDAKIVQTKVENRSTPRIL